MSNAVATGKWKAALEVFVPLTELHNARTGLSRLGFLKAKVSGTNGLGYFVSASRWDETEHHAQVRYTDGYFHVYAKDGGTRLDAGITWDATAERWRGPVIEAGGHVRHRSALAALIGTAISATPTQWAELDEWFRQ